MGYPPPSICSSRVIRGEETHEGPFEVTLSKDGVSTRLQAAFCPWGSSGIVQPHVTMATSSLHPRDPKLVPVGSPVAWGCGQATNPPSPCSRGSVVVNYTVLLQVLASNKAEESVETISKNLISAFTNYTSCNITCEGDNCE